MTLDVIPGIVNSFIMKITHSKTDQNPCLMGMDCIGCESETCPAEMKNLDIFELNGENRAYGTQLEYKCPLGQNYTGYGSNPSSLVTECQWDQTWTISSLPSCKGTE